MKPTSSSAMTLPLEDQIREAAYFHWLDHGSRIGDDWTSWLSAEKTIRDGSALAIVSETHVVWPAAQAIRSESPSHLKAGHGHDHRPEILAGGAAQRSRSRHTRGKE